MIIDQTLFHVFDSFNPFIPNGQEYEAGYNQACKEYLFYANYAQGKIQPWLGKSWKYNSDFTQMTITLDTTAHWSDGTPFTSKDVAFTANMLIKNATLLNGTDLRKFVDTVSTPDNATVVFKLKTANPRFHYGFICGIVSGFHTMPEHIWSSQDPTTFKNNPPVQTGPYKLNQVLPNQFMFVWEKDPNYWNKANLDPKPQYVVYRTAPVQDSAVEEFKRAQTDLPGNVDYSHMQAIKAGGYQNMQIQTAFRDPCPRGVWINSDPSKGVLADPRMHTVISSLLDRQKIGSTVWLISTPPAQYPWADYKSNNVWTNDATAKQYPQTYDPAKAKSLLDEMGATAGSNGKRTFQGKPISLEIMTPVVVGQPEYEVAQLLAGELTKLGIDASARAYQGPVFDQKYTTGQFDITSHWLCGVSFDPDQLYTNLEMSRLAPIGTRTVNGNEVRLHDQALSDDATKLDVLDPASAAAKPLFDKALVDYYKALPAVPVIQTTYPTAYRRQPVQCACQLVGTVPLHHRQHQANGEVVTSPPAPPLEREGSLGGDYRCSSLQSSLVRTREATGPPVDAPLPFQGRGGGRGSLQRRRLGWRASQRRQRRSCRRPRRPIRRAAGPSIRPLPTCCGASPCTWSRCGAPLPSPSCSFGSFLAIRSAPLLTHSRRTRSTTSRPAPRCLPITGRYSGCRGTCSSSTSTTCIRSSSIMTWVRR